MPYPIPTGHNFEITYNESSANHYMPTMCDAEHYEISMIISGDRQSITPDRIYYSRSGSVNMSKPYVLHQTSSVSDTVYKRILIKFSIKIGDELRKKIGSSTFDELFSEHTLYFTEEGTSIITNKFWEMLEEYKNYNNYTNDILAGMIFHLFTMIIKYKRENPDILPVSFECRNKTITNALNYIHCHYHEDMTMEDVCKYIGLTPSYFSKLFKETMGTTYSEYVILSKLQCCRVMLMQTDFSVQEIAEKSGLCNGNYLSTLFKKYYHETPREFRTHCEATKTSDVINKPLYD